MQQVEAGLVGADVGQLVQRGDLHARSVAGVAALQSQKREKGLKKFNYSVCCLRDHFWL